MSRTKNTRAVPPANPPRTAAADTWDCGNHNLQAQATIEIILHARLFGRAEMEMISDTLYEAGPDYCLQIANRFGHTDVPF